MNFIVAKKLNMSQHFLESGEVIPVTVLKATPMVVTRVKQKTGKDKYEAVQVGVKASIAGKRSHSKAVTGQLKGTKGVGKLVEFTVADASGYSEGQALDLGTFQIGELVTCVGTMKGRGFAGAIKRHGFAGFPASHGHDRPRSVGSIGQRFPQHVRKGLRMAGHMGTTQVTVKNLQVVSVDVAKGLIAVKGAVPGHRNGMVKIVSTGTVKPVGKPVEVKEEKKKK
ncbi:MAG: 50S ribosomal protein L3 [Candidatus Doudnabacteria bacterium]|nr:50S ribosomal protein L3 [Candidatus Doudnabacteria bacterium]